ncbi:MAG: hypothetical protein JF606_07135 [Burkholderiales bacterium]|jgi:hypothetical protein|nr:hypothetical protein [Burkholderiales bacterium]
MAKPNYSFEKRQRELAKKKKKVEKLQEKAARKTSGGGVDQGEEATQDGSPADGTKATDTQPNP